MTQARDLADGKFDTNTLVVDAANNRVGVGVASPSQKLHVEGAGTQFLFLNNSTTNDGLYLKAGSGATSLQTNGGDHTINFFTSGTERLRILSGGGLTFNGDTATANALNDYEEGTFTVTDASGAGLSLTQNTTATYVKVGKLVFVSFYVTYPSNTDSTISLLGGFPFAMTNLYTYLSGRTLSHGQDDMVFQLNGATVTARLHYNNATRTNAQLSNAYVLVSGCYIADA